MKSFPNSNSSVGPCMRSNSKGIQFNILKTVLIGLLCLLHSATLWAQKKLPLLNARSEKALILDGEHVKINWKLDPNLKPDTYYINIPAKKGKVKFQTDLDEITFRTSSGKTHDFVVILNGKDSCFTRIVATEAPTPVSMSSAPVNPKAIPFSLIGSRIYFKGLLNQQKEVTIQFDLGAGGSVVNKSSVDKLQLAFTGKATLSNTDGVNEARLSFDNLLKLGDFSWEGVPIVEVGNMKPFEDLIIGNSLFRNKLIEIDYDKMLFVVHETLPAYAKDFRKQAVYFEQDRPRFKADFIQNGKKHSFWFLFDTGREGTMLIGEDFTASNNNWDSLKELQIINGRKIVRLDARIAGVEFKDIVTNAADPSKPAGRPTLFGNQVLNHFNVILDNRQGYIYLKPNSRADEPYSDYESYLKEMSGRK